MDGPKDDLKWFGEGFDGFPKRLPEDTVEYTLVIGDGGASQRDVLAKLEAVKREANSLSARLLRDYIWQRDSFGLELIQTPGESYYAMSYLLIT